MLLVVFFWSILMRLRGWISLWVELWLNLILLIFLMLLWSFFKYFFEFLGNLYFLIVGKSKLSVCVMFLISFCLGWKYVLIFVCLMLIIIIWVEILVF